MCWIGRTNPVTHQIIKDNLDKSPLYTGKIKSIGPGYCPSIKDKVIRFGERDAHTLFLEPESIKNQELYLKGLSTTLPFIEKTKRFEDEKIPETFDYDSIQGLLTESRIKMKENKPNTLGQASRIPGITPADISILAINLAKKQRQNQFHVKQKTPEQEKV